MIVSEAVLWRSRNRSSRRQWRYPSTATVRPPMENSRQKSLHESRRFDRKNISLRPLITDYVATPIWMMVNTDFALPSRVDD